MTDKDSSSLPDIDKLDKFIKEMRQLNQESDYKLIKEKEDWLEKNFDDIKININKYLNSLKKKSDIEDNEEVILEFYKRNNTLIGKMKVKSNIIIENLIPVLSKYFDIPIYGIGYFTHAVVWHNYHAKGDLISQWKESGKPRIILTT